MTSREIRQKYLAFFEARGHKIIPSASLIPAETDPTVLFTTAGMHPLVPYLMGENHPGGKRLVNLQRCIRTGDIDEVGDESHLTYFEMMGYWSLGAYWKEEAIKLIFEFLTQELGLDQANFAATCFEGDEKNGIVRDTEAHDIWRSLGLPEERIAYLGYEDNWWGPAGATGPCGPDSELFVWVGEGEAPAKFDPQDKGWMELCNDVFMQYNKTAEGKFEPLAQKNVDFGMGFERLVSYLQKKNNVYETDLFEPIIRKIEEISGKKYQENLAEFRIIADHLRAATFAVADGVLPSNKGAGYVVRRLIRRVIVKGKQIGIAQNFCGSIVEIICHSELDPESSEIPKQVRDDVEREEERFLQTVERGLKKLEITSNTEYGQIIDGKIDWGKVELFADDLFNLYQQEGLPFEVAMEEAKRLGIPIAVKAYETANVMKKINEEFEIKQSQHQNLSRTASAGMFKGGLADSSEETTRLHTAAHLLLASLRKVLGDHVIQKGSNITAERLRFDFSHPEKMTPEQVAEVEKLVNEAIAKKADVSMEELSIVEAKKAGAHGVFDERYGDKVKVYTITDTATGEVISKEICGGPHVSNTGELGHFRIKKEESSSAGVRRIKANLE